MTYQQAYDKIIPAYFRDEIEPLDPSFCFCGTLCDNSADWMLHTATSGDLCLSVHNDYAGYKGADFAQMEFVLFRTTRANNGGTLDKHKKTYENALFLGMCAALEVLKEIHRSRGEDVDSLPALTKSNLQPII